jgi:hypothetical protein
MESHFDESPGAGDSSAVDTVQDVIKRIKSHLGRINQTLKSLESYDKRVSRNYESQVSDIESFFELCKLEHFSDDQKRQVYEGVFESLNKSELLCLPQGLRKRNRDPDEDLLLVCASRASRTKSSLFICDTTFIDNILATSANIPLVNNLGILHHYGMSQSEEFLPEEVSQAKEFTLAKIPILIKERIKNQDLKVVLRCCRGGQDPSNLKNSPKMKVYPFEIFTAPVAGEQKGGSPTEVRFKSECDANEKIVMMQQMVNARVETKIFLPGITKEPLVRVDFPVLTLTLNEGKKSKLTNTAQKPKHDSAKALTEKEKQTIKDFSRQLILALNEQFQIHPEACLFIDPSNVSVFGQNHDNTDLWSQIKNQVKSCLNEFHKEFERPPSHPSYSPQFSSGLDKKHQQRFFAVANSSKDTPIPQKSYAGELLAKIKGESVAVFKTYCSGYIPYKDRMVTETDATNLAKSITVTRDENYSEALPEEMSDEAFEQKAAAGGGLPDKK